MKSCIKKLSKGDIFHWKNPHDLPRAFEVMRVTHRGFLYQLLGYPMSNGNFMEFSAMEMWYQDRIVKIEKAPR